MSLLTHRDIRFPAFGAANLIRGQFGRTLFEKQYALFERLFAPPRRSEGPSGLADPPRAYVLRTSQLDGKSFPAGTPLEFTVHVFDLKLAAAFAEFPMEQFRLSLLPSRSVQRVRVDFLSPTELKNAEQPEFGPLFARLRDRVSTLRALYGTGALEIDFSGMAARAAGVRLLDCQISHVDRSRSSRRTGQAHPLGGFVGSAVYEGELGEFLPYLEAGSWTGVGRQTVWGKGEIRISVLGDG